ncbi:DciA family protein [Hyphomicrobium sp. CS1GBMeth3]|uniref:DUF721 domain-containing protein n=1 Tax=Hyphomicrobium sp. CS1GBMeth3 TaxID=1892845 RepID=UPI001558819C|nr:DciA family protein [Hyphomicrobium sp. CS1GBMeth3]
MALPPRTEPRFAAPPTARFVAVKAVGSFVPTLTKKAFEKFGFSTAALITDWERIAGAELARYTMPDKLKWPRATDAAYDDENERRGATLTLRVDPARALDVEYRARQILERINSYFGYRAIETIRLIQAPLDRSAPQPPAVAPPARHQEAVSATADEGLLAALARLESGVRSDRSSRRS